MKWLALIILMGCTQVTSLNMKKHVFGVTPSKIIWFQVAGLDLEHLALLRFRETTSNLTSFERSTCTGRAWAYNLFKIRNPAQTSFLAQTTGKMNVQNSCEDAELRPLWSYLGEENYTTVVLENGASSEQTLSSFKACGQRGEDFLGNATLLLQEVPPAGAKTYFYSDEINLTPGQISYDKSCTKKGCATGLADNFRSVYESLKSKGKHIYIFRDFSYLSALEKKDFLKAREILRELERSYAYALALAQDSGDTLVLLTSGETRFVDFPDQGKNWFQLEKKGEAADVKRTILTNLVLASGARAENFCGFFSEAEIMSRVLSGPKQQGLELKFINPLR
jgi:hypothetical protein